MAKSYSKEAPNSENSQRINEEIGVSPVRVIGEDGEQLGVLATEKALELAKEADLDLVEVAPDARPPVCRIMDFGKYKYQKGKREQKTHKSKIKEIRLRPRTDANDIMVKVNRARTFLSHKDKVLITLTFRGRETVHEEEGHRVMQTVIENLEDVAKVEQPLNRQGKRLSCVLAPRG